MTTPFIQPDSNGTKTDTCYLGTEIFAGVALVISIILVGWVAFNTEDKSQRGTNMK